MCRYNVDREREVCSECIFSLTALCVGGMLLGLRYYDTSRYADISALINKYPVAFIFVPFYSTALASYGALAVVALSLLGHPRVPKGLTSSSFN